MKVIDATNLKVGRLASYVAKDALNGETINIINTEKAVITGTKSSILERFRKKRSVGSRYQGPFYPKRDDRIVKRVIRGMLPYKKKSGREALDRIKTYLGVPPEFEKEKAVTIEGADRGVMEKRLYMSIDELARLIGANQ
jgi:large subunit ribosomal protein L13